MIETKKRLGAAEVKEKFTKAGAKGITITDLLMEFPEASEANLRMHVYKLTEEQSVVATDDKRDGKKVYVATQSLKSGPVENEPKENNKEAPKSVLPTNIKEKTTTKMEDNTTKIEIIQDLKEQVQFHESAIKKIKAILAFIEEKGENSGK